MPLPPGEHEILDDLAGDAVLASDFNLLWEDEYFNDKSRSITKTPMDSAHIGIDLSDRSSNDDVADAARLRNVGESQHGNEDSERNYTIVLKPVE
jgi:hypothetical protein